MAAILIIALIVSLIYYIPKSIEYHNQPVNFYIVLPVLGFFSIFGAVFFMTAFENPVGLFIFAGIINVILFVIHVVIHTQKFNLLYAIIHYFVQGIIGILILSTLGAILWLFFIGLNIFCDGVSSFFTEFFDDDDRD